VRADPRRSWRKSMNISGERITDKIWQELKGEKSVIVKFE